MFAPKANFLYNVLDGALLGPLLMRLGSHLLHSLCEVSGHWHGIRERSGVAVGIQLIYGELLDYSAT